MNLKTLESGDKIAADITLDGHTIVYTEDEENSTVIKLTPAELKHLINHLSSLIQ